MNHTIKGKITLTNQQPAAGLTLEAWEDDIKHPDLISKVTTDTNGHFSITFDETYWKEHPKEQHPRVFFKVYDPNGQLLRDTREQIYWTEDQKQTPVAITIGEVPPAEDPQEAENRAATTVLGKLAGLPQNAIDRLLEKNIAPGRIHSVTLNHLVNEKLIDETRRKTLSRTLNFYRLSGSHLGLTKALAKKFDSERALIALDTSDWEQLLTKNKLTPPAEQSMPEYARTLIRSVARTFPTPFLMERLAGRSRAKELDKINAIAPLFQQNKTIFSNGRIAELDWTGIPGAQQKKAKAALEQLQKLVHSYKYLGLDSIINNRRIAPDKKEAAMTKKLDALRKFHESNPGLDLRITHFSGKNIEGLKTPDWSKVPAKERTAVRKQMMSYQRILLLSTDPEVTKILLEEGLDSNYKIGNLSRKALGDLTGLSPETVDRLYKKARESRVATNHFLEMIMEVVNANPIGIMAVHFEPDMINELKEIDGYDELFGLHGYCHCEHCRSIFSPAAYFVDLMHFVEKHVPGSEVPAGNSIHLKTRRADLWQLELTCENTNTLIPYLAIVNEVLETFIAQQNSGKNAYTVLQGAQYAFGLPFHLPLTEIRTYLKHFGLTLAELAGIINPDSMHPELLGLSPDEYTLIANANESLALHLFGLSADADSMPVPGFLAVSGLKREELDAVLKASFIVAGGGPLPVVKRIKLSDDIQQYTEEIQHLSPATLDRIHRFIRLYKKLPWSIAELDLILNRLSVTNEFTDDAFFSIAGLLQLQSKLSLSVDELTGLFSDLPQQYIVQHFTPAGFLSLDPEERKAALISGLKITASELEFLNGELGISDATMGDLYQLFRYTKLAKRLDLSPEEILHVVELSGLSTPVTGWEINAVKSLVTFAEKLKALPFSVDECRQLLKTDTFYISEEEKQELKTLAAATLDRSFSAKDLAEALEMNTAEATTLLTLLHDLNYLIKIKTAQKVQWRVTRVLETLSDKKWEQIFSLVLKNELFQKKLLSFLESHSVFSTKDFAKTLRTDTAMATALLGLLQELKYVIKTAQKEHWEVAKALKTPNDEEWERIFNTISRGETFRKKFRSFFGSHFRYTTILTLLSEQLQKDYALISTIADRFYNTDKVQDGGTGNSDTSLHRFAKFIPELGRWLFLSEQFNLDTEFFSFIADDQIQNRVFALEKDDKDTITPEVLFRLRQYHRFSSMAPEDKAIDLHTLIVSYQNGSFDHEQFALLTDKAPVLVNSIYEHRQILFPETAEDKKDSAPEAFDKLLRLVEWCEKPGINGEALVRLYSQKYDDLEQVAKSLKAAFRSKYEDDAELQEKLEPYTDALLVAKRDALTAYIQSRKGWNFTTLDDLYEYFLLDVEMDGCARTSKVKAAISSLQLYVHRCLMRLEQSEQEPGIMADIDEEGRAEWEWRKNYRVWEANRKVFLYPENYIEPDLRDNKSPQFKELETELLQREITKEAAEEAYKKYLTRFSELGKLIIAGGYYNTAENTYYFFGRTNTDPYQYFYRTYEPDSGLWSAWEKIELAINAPYVSPIKHLGRLFIFWVEKSVLEKTKIEAAISSSDSFDINFTAFYSYVDEGGKWKNAQKFHEWQSTNLTADVRDDLLSIKKLRKVYPSVSDSTLLRESYIVDGTFFNKLDLYRNKLITDGKFHDDTLPEYDRIWVKDDSETSTILLSDHAVYMLANSDAMVDNSYKKKLSSIPYHPITKELSLIDDNDIHVVINKKEEAFFMVDNHQILIRDYKIPEEDTLSVKLPKKEMVHLSTNLPDKLGEIIHNNGIDAFLSLKSQKQEDYAIRELYKPGHFLILIKGNESDMLPFNGAYGLYYRELYFHIPFLIANHLNATGKYAEAAYWYEKIFNPTAPKDDWVDPARPSDRVWQHIRFRNRDVKSLETILTDKAAIDQYKSDPFNPHAIARLRISAYQKAIVMKYIDNLLDWGDHLFAQDTYESINEATMLYVLAKDILGKKPVETGDCKSLPKHQLTYEKLAPTIKEGSEFLIALENEVIKISTGQFIKKNPAENPKSEVFLGYAEPINNDTEQDTPPSGTGNFIDFEATRLLAFCIPPNKTLLGYWDRVADRLFKVRHCMNIKGMTRELALFQPPIDPMMLVKAKAAGLNLTDVIQSLSATPPAYRFSYLIEKAKQFAGTVQSFGSALLSALEKKDVEDLTLLRNLHEQNILTLTRTIKEKQIEEAQAQLASLKEAEKRAKTEEKYYEDLILKGLLDSEFVQQSAHYTSTIISSGAAITGYIMAAVGLIPKRVGLSISPGGEEAVSVAEGIFAALNTMAAVSKSVAELAGMEASFERRKQRWNQQLKLVLIEERQIAQQQIAAEIREEIAEKDLKIHQTQTEQAKELYDFYKDKFTNLGLYDHLSNTLSDLYREAYNMALAMARKAEQAYNYERDATSIMISGSHWQADKAGLLAGEKLLLELQQLEVAYLEANTREYEITQTFSLMQLDATALVQLKAAGSCEFALPEYAYDLVYPGHYKRRIKSVRLSIPCVTGPYTNVNATLNLLSSQIRRSPDINNAMDAVPKTVVNTIATSNANNDAGVFELNFRDERFLPFEGAGAISDWKLQLPETFQTFDYKSISDVLIHVSYTAVDGGDLYRNTVEADLQEQLKDTQGMVLPRLFSLKNEFPEAWFEAKEKGEALSITITKQMFPFAFQGKTIQHEQTEYVTVSLGGKISRADGALNWVVVNAKPKDGPWDIDFEKLNFNEADDVLLVFTYKLN